MENNPLWIINHRSGGGEGSDLASRVGDRAISFSEFLKNPTTWVQSAPELVLVAGGDGTVGTVAHAFSNVGGHKLGIIPLGTGNDMARELGIPLRIAGESTLATVDYFMERTSPISCSQWALIDKKSQKTITTVLNYLSLGFEAEVVLRYAKSRLTPSSANSLGVWKNRGRFIHAAIRSLPDRLPDISLSRSHASQEPVYPVRGRSLLFANIRSILGIGISNSISDPRDDLIEAINTTSLLGFIPVLLTALHPRFARSKQVLQSHEWHINLPPGPLVIQSDGEGLEIETSGELLLLKTGTVLLLASPSWNRQR